MSPKAFVVVLMWWHIHFTTTTNSNPRWSAAANVNVATTFHNRTCYRNMSSSYLLVRMTMYTRLHECYRKLVISFALMMYWERHLRSSCRMLCKCKSCSFYAPCIQHRPIWDNSIQTNYSIFWMTFSYFNNLKSYRFKFLEIICSSRPVKWLEPGFLLP